MDMTTRRLVLTGMVAGALALTTRGRAFAAPTAIEQRPVHDFDQVVWDATGELLIRQTDREHLSVEAEPAVLSKIVTQVRQRRLWIGFAPGSIETRQPLRFVLEVKSLAALEALGSGDARIGPLSTQRLSLLLGGSNKVHLERLVARALAVRLAGSGEVAIAGGQVDSQRIVLEGSGDYLAARLASRDAEVVIDGSGNARIAASERLVARIAGSGDVHYLGDPQVSSDVSGAGSVTRAKKA
jgi:hypothetical protein